MSFESRNIYASTQNLDISSYQLGSSIMYAPAQKGQQDFSDKNIVGNLVYKHNYYNDVLSMPIYDKEHNNDKYKLPFVYEKEGRFSDNLEENFHLENADFFFTQNTAHKGYEKLVNAIENEQKIEFTQENGKLDDFSQLGEYDDLVYDNYYVGLIKAIEHYNEVFNPLENQTINDTANYYIGNNEYSIHFSPLTQHIYVNDTPTHSVNEQNEIRVLNDNLSKDMEKDFFNKDYKFSYNDYKVLEEDSYTYIDLNDYMNENNNFVQNLIEDIPPTELLVDSAKQRINTIDQQMNYRDISIMKNDLNNFAQINNFENLDEVSYLINSYDDYLNVISNNIESDIDKEGLKSLYIGIDEPLHIMNSSTFTIYDHLENDFRDNYNLTRKDGNTLNEVLTYLSDSKNNIGNLIAQHEASKQTMISKNSLAILDNEKYKMVNKEFHTNSDKLSSESYYEGMKSAILPINNVTPQDYRNREQDIEIISEFVKYAKSEVSNVDIKPNFINDKLESKNSSIDFDSILIGSEINHDLFIESLKEESKQTIDYDLER